MTQSVPPVLEWHLPRPHDLVFWLVVGLVMAKVIRDLHPRSVRAELLATLVVVAVAAPVGLALDLALGGH